MSEGRKRDVTINEDRYIRMPVKMLWIFIAGLCIATWAYFDVITQAKITRGEAAETRTIALEAIALSNANNIKLNSIDQRQATMDQKITDFIESSEKVYNRYFRERSDPDFKRK
jgi:c-di-AMP phosphodiesterase-like protein